MQSHEEDLSGIYIGDKDEYNSFLEEYTNIPFDFSCELPIRLLKIKQANNMFSMIITLHHAAVDGWSVGILQSELNAIYAALVNNQDVDLKEIPYKYVDYASWQKSDAYKELSKGMLSFWKEYLKDANYKLNYPIEFLAEKNQKLKCDGIEVTIDADLAKKIRDWINEQKISMFNLMLSVYYMALYEFTGDDNISIGTPAANRNRLEFMDVFGYFANTVVINDVRNEILSFEEYVMSVEENAYKVFANQELPFHILVSEFRGDDNGADASLFQTMFSVQNEALIHKGNRASNVEKLQIGQLGRQQAIEYPMILSVIDSKEKLQITLSYHTSKFSERRMHAFLKGMEELLLQIMENDKLAISEYQSESIQKDLKQYGRLSKTDENIEIEEQIIPDNSFPDICEKVIDIWVDIIGNNEINEDDKFFQVGGNSIKAISVMDRINETFDINIKIEDLFRYTTVKAMAGLINQKANYVKNELNESNMEDTIFEEF